MPDARKYRLIHPRRVSHINVPVTLQDAVDALRICDGVEPGWTIVEDPLTDLRALVEQARQAAVDDKPQDEEILILWDALNTALGLLGLPTVSYEDVYGQ